MTYLVEVKELKKNYSSKEAVKGISFNIKENEILITQEAADEALAELEAEIEKKRNE